MPFIFLDIDGVLNPCGLSDAARRGTAKPDRPPPGAGSRIDRALVARVDQIVTATGATLVLCSRWRIRPGLTATRTALAAAGLRAPIDHATPSLPAGGRGAEIAAWLRANPARAWVVLDDGMARDFAGIDLSRVVRVRGRVGLTDGDVAEAIRILGTA